MASNTNGDKKAKILSIFKKKEKAPETSAEAEEIYTGEGLEEAEASDLFAGLPPVEEEIPEPEKTPASEVKKPESKEASSEESSEETASSLSFGETTGETQDQPKEEKEEKRSVLNVSVAESAKDRQDSRSLTEIFGRNKLIWLIVGIVALLILLIVIMFSDRLYNQVKGQASYTLTESQIHVSFAEGNVGIGIYDNQLLRCSQDGIQALTEKGNVVWDIPFTMSAPTLKVAGDYISVADQLGMRIMIINAGNVTTEVTTESNILMSALNELGQAAVVLSAKDGHIVNLYSAQGDLLMQRRTFQISDGIPIAVALSENGTRMATVYVNYTGTVLKSIITVFDLTESGSLLVDRVVGSIAYEDIVISDLKFIGNRLFFAGSEIIGAVSTRDGVEKEWEKSLGYRIEALVMADDYVALRFGEGLAGTAERVDKNIVIYNYSGNVISDQYIQGASYLGASNDTVIIGSGRSYTAISSGGAIKWTMDSTEDYMELLAFPGGKSVAALKRSQIDFYNVTLKGAVLEDD